MKDDEILDEQDETIEQQPIEEQTEEQDDNNSVEHSNYKIPNHFDASIKYHLTGMYQNWFLDYASYVILERAVPDIYDGLKPVQRRILHAMKRLDDGRYNKVANIVGHTMQFHPHGDASIGDALVQLGQKELLIDCQGNWGNILTGDSAAAPRYIEARLSKFALDAVFNPKTTHWKQSYDGRNKEPINLPVKFPLLLAQGVEGIAVGLNSKILPHNFNELCDAAIAYLKEEDFVLYPDFQTGGSIDVSRYNDGERGGVVKIRSKISKLDNKTLVISEVPYGTNATKLIETILRANDKGKIKIRKVDDNTSAQVEILVHLQPGSSSDKTIDALYAFTDCELSISPNCCVVCDKKPIFTTVSQLLKISTDHTKDLLRWELEIKLDELEASWHWISLEKIFFEKRIYKILEKDAESYEKQLDGMEQAFDPYRSLFKREITHDDIIKLCEKPVRKISKFDIKKAEEQILDIEKQIEEVKNELNHLVDYAINWFETLKKKYGSDFPRRTELRNFETIVAAKVVEANEKLYINREEGFIGTSLKKDEFICNCSDIDEVILFYKDGKYKIVKVADKLFVGTNILHLDIFKKNDTRTIYNAVYRDGKNGAYFMKRFAVTGIARDKEYDLTQGKAGSRVIYFTANPNGEAEIIRVQLKPALKLRKLEVLKDLSELGVKGRQSRGNLLTKYEVHRVTLKQKGVSTLGGRKVWFDPDVLRLNYDQRGMYLGEFHSEDHILVITQNGDFYTTGFELTNHYENNILRIEKFNANKTWSVALWDDDLQFYYLKRFSLEASAKPLNFLGENANSRLIVLSDSEEPIFKINFGGADKAREALTIDVTDFIGIKSHKAKGKRISTYEIASITDITPEPEIVEEPEEEENTEDNTTESETTQESTVPETKAEETGAESITKEVQQKEETSDEVPKKAEKTATPQAEKSQPNDDLDMEIIAIMPDDSLPANEEKTKKTRGKKSKEEDANSEGQMSLF